MLILSGVSFADDRIDQINRVESQYQSNAIQNINFQTSYPIPGTSLQILPTPNKNGFVTVDPTLGRNVITVYDPTVTPNISKRYVDCKDYSYYHSLQFKAETREPKPKANSYGAALIYAACHLPPGN